MATALKIYLNCDTVDQPQGATGVDWVEMNTTLDKLIFTQGSTGIVDDGYPIPTPSQLNQAAVLLTGSEIVVPKYFLADNNTGLLDQIHLAGAQDKQYVFCFEFDGATASEPVLEVWDDSGLDSVLLEVLGAGTPTNSWYRGICTTTAKPGLAAWVGTKLAGSTASYYLLLNDGNGALGAAGDLYMQFKVVIPATASYSGTASPVLVCKYTTN